MSIRIKAIFIIMSIVFAITAAFFLLSMYFTKQSMVKAMEQDLSLAAKIADDLVSTTIRLLKADTATIAERLLKADSKKEMMDITEEQLAEFPRFISLTVFDRDGIVVNGGESIFFDEMHPNDQQIAFNGGSVISTTHYNGLGSFVMHVFVPMGHDMVLSTTLSGMIFAELLSNYKLWETGSIYMLDETGAVIAHYRQELVLERLNYIEESKDNPELSSIGIAFRKIVSTDMGIDKYIFEGKERLCSYKRVTGSTSGWRIIVSVPFKESPLVDLQRGLLLSALCFLAAGLLIAILISGIVVKPFKKIEDQNRDLAVLNEQVMASSVAKTNFLANMSHEMRTPLNAVVGLSELTLGNNGLSRESSSNLEKINNAGMTLLSIVNDILDISKIESGKFELIPVEYDVPSMLNDTITQSILHIGEKPIQFILNINKNLPIRLFGDDLRVKQILNNLLSNAFKYTREGTVQLDISHDREDSVIWLIVSVQDTGIGIKAEHLENLFSDYAQIDTKSNRKIEGTGLGLSISKRLLDMMGGMINIESEYGKGSVFNVRIKQQFVTDSTIGAEVVNSLKNFHYSDQKRSRKLLMSRIKLPYAKVLVVDDVITNLDVAKGMLKPYGMQIDYATSGKEAISAIRNEKTRYNAIFMDHMMPEMDGIEATRIIREEIGTEYAKNIPIIALTANAIAGNEEMFLSKGFQAFISKPIEIERLDSIVRQWIRDKNQQEEFFNENNEEQKKMGAAQILSYQVDGVDLQKCLERFGGDEESILQVLQSYVSNTSSLLDSARGVSRENLSNYAITVHGLKSSSKGICAEKIGEMAADLENAAKTGDFDFVIINNKPFTDASEKLIGQLKDMLHQIAIAKPKPKKDQPDKELLDRLITACKNYNMDQVDAALLELESYEYETEGDLVKWLRENVDKMNFEQIQEKLKT